MASDKFTPEKQNLRLEGGGENKTSALKAEENSHPPRRRGGEIRDPVLRRGQMVDPNGIEPLTSSMPLRRSTN